MKAFDLIESSNIKQTINISGTSEPNELDMELLSVHGLNPFIRHDSSSRSQMFSSHLTQRLCIADPDERLIKTGMEQELAKYTLSTKMPANGKIIKVIERYPKNISTDSIAFNPESLVIYEDEDTNEIGSFSINYYTSYHQYFGFKNKFNQTNISKIVPGNFIPKDTVFADTGAVTAEGDYAYGINLNMAFMSHPATSEDGILISDKVLDRLKFKLYETRVAEYGNNCFPLNLYGTVDNYKPFPDIGETIRDDGLLMMLRDYDLDICPAHMSKYDVMEPDFIFDKAIYVRGGGGGRIIDIKVYHDENSSSTTPIGMETFINKYIKAKRNFYQTILDTEKELKIQYKRKYGTHKLKLKPELHRLIVEALSMLDGGGIKSNEVLHHIHRKDPLDDYRIEFTIEYEVRPNIGYKLTDTNGGKGVNCLIEKHENMPVDSAGNIADIVMDPNSTLGRLNLGRIYETYITGSIRDTTKILKKVVESNIGKFNNARNAVELFYDNNKTAFYELYNYLLNFYLIASPIQHDFFSKVTDEEKVEHLADCIERSIMLYMPPNNNRETDDIIRLLEKYYRPTYGTVSYVGITGNRVHTLENVRIAPLYMMLLEKIGDDWASVSSAKLQHFGILSPMTKGEKYSLPFRNSPVRTIGETEGRLYAAYCGREAIAEMMDRNNSPLTHKAVVNSILNADKPGNIEVAVDRNIIQLGASKPLAIINHIGLCAGYKLTHYKETE